MTMQYDIKSAHITQSGYLSVGNRSRLKQISYAPNGSQAGSLVIFDTNQVPIAAVYQRSGTTITVTKSSHGLTTGTMIGIGFNVASGASATDGNYAITVIDPNSFTITDPNSGTVSGGTGCQYVVAYPTGDQRYQNANKWLAQFDTVAGGTTTQAAILPGEGLLCQNGIYAQLNYITYCTCFYG